MKIYSHYHVVQWQVSRAVAVLSLCAATHLDSLNAIHAKVSCALILDANYSFERIIFVVCQTHKNILTQKFSQKISAQIFSIFGIHYMNIE